MRNPLTGDFQAVLQVSGGTINRLAASMHRNSFAKSNLPSAPHSLWIRIGDDHALDGARGTLQAQVGVPRVELIHGVTDRFILEFGVRAWYKPDPGTTPLPAFIHGTVRAEYRIQDIDPHCFGWSAASAANFIWIRVVRESVQFRGTTEEDRDPFIVAAALNPADAATAQATNEAKVTNQIAVLLATRFAALPHPVSKRFRRGSMRSLNAPIGGSAVALPIALGGEPSGQIGSIENLILEGSDFAIGVTRDYLLSLAEPALAALRAPIPSKEIHVHVGMRGWIPDVDITTVYRVQINPPTVDWQPYGSFAIIKIKLSGTASTDSILPNATFEVDQDVMLKFDAADEMLSLVPGSRTVTAKASGVGGGTVANVVKDEVSKQVKSRIASACAQAQPMLDAMIGRKQELVDQLRTIDDQANATVGQALFLRDGLILRGVISLTRLGAPLVSFEKTLAHDGFSALQSWIPGGRIDKFEWSWTWAGQGDPGFATHDDRFVLRRPWGKMSRWGMAVGLSVPLPGIDGNGTVCLRIRGVQVDAVTGDLVPVQTVTRCKRFGINVSIYARSDWGRLFLRDVPELSRDVPFPQLALMEVEGAPRSAAANTLLLYFERSWDREIASTLRGGLEGTRRDDAGLILLVLFREGVLGAVGSHLACEVEEIGRTLGIATLVNEDVRGGWNTAYALRAGSGELAWRLLSPGGGVTWMHDGRLAARELAAALDHYLIPSPQPKPGLVRHGVAIGMQVSAAALHPGFRERDGNCPPLPIGRGIVASTVVSFVQRDSAASEAQLRKLSAQYGERGDESPRVVVVVDGADERETERMKNEIGFEFATFPDSGGRITDRFGIRIWPTTITIDRTGTVSGVEVGLSGAHHRACERGEAE
jgi:hypothetical protein